MAQRFIQLADVSEILDISSAQAYALVRSGTATAKRFGLGYALRGLSRNRSVVSLVDIGGLVTTGTIDAVGADAVSYTHLTLPTNREV